MVARLQHLEVVQSLILWRSMDPSVLLVHLHPESRKLWIQYHKHLLLFHKGNRMLVHVMLIHLMVWHLIRLKMEQAYWIWWYESIKRWFASLWINELKRLNNELIDETNANLGNERWRTKRDQISKRISTNHWSKHWSKMHFSKATMDLCGLKSKICFEFFW